MFKKTSFLTTLAVTIGIIWTLNNQMVVGEKNLPAFGKLFNPYTGFWKNATPVMPTKGTFSIELDSMVGAASVWFDDRSVPHIFAENALDAYRIQGYLTARDRLWQMDFMVRDAAGRLSEVVGKKTIKRDQFKRNIGMTLAAERDLENWKSDTTTYEFATAYARGVNDYIQSLTPANYPLEYKLLNYHPEPWTPMHSALISKSMAASLCLRAKDVEATNALAYFGEENFRFIYPEHFPEQLPIIPKEVDIQSLVKTVDLSNTTKMDFSGNFDFFYTDENVGSNNWAISAGKSAAGVPMLAGDPHLQLTLPSIWYEIQIHLPESNAYGVSLPGLPGVVIGHNENIAWSMTNTGHDVGDFYKIQWKDSTYQEYFLDSQYVKINKRIEKYLVKYGNSIHEIIDTIRMTRWGPVITDQDDLEDLAFHWMAHHTGEKSDLPIFYNLNKAKNKEEFQEALLGFASPSQNFAFADKNGDIGMFIRGKWPHKEQGQGRFIQDGTKTTNEWKGSVPTEDMPTLVNPKWGYVSSANQHSTTKNFPYYYNNENFEAYRGRFLADQLNTRTNLSTEDLQNLQLSNYSLKTDELFDMLIAPLDTNAMNNAERAIYNLLLEWNFEYEGQKLNPVYFQEWFRNIYEMTWQEVLSQDKYEKILFPSHWRTIYIMRDLPNSNYFDLKDTPEREEAPDVILLAFQKMVKDIALRLLEEPDLNWAKYRDTHIRHLAQIKGFSREEVPSHGYGKALNAVTSRTGPSWRMVVAMDTIPKAKVVYPGGQSGNPGDTRYDEFLDDWITGNYYDAVFLTNKEEASKKCKMELKFQPKED